MKEKTEAVVAVGEFDIPSGFQEGKSCQTQNRGRKLN
jgi:hypothetical protein